MALEMRWLLPLGLLMVPVAYLVVRSTRLESDTAVTGAMQPDSHAQRDKMASSVTHEENKSVEENQENSSITDGERQLLGQRKDPRILTDEESEPDPMDLLLEPEATQHLHADNLMELAATGMRYVTGMDIKTGCTKLSEDCGAICMCCDDLVKRNDKCERPGRGQKCQVVKNQAGQTMHPPQKCDGGSGSSCTIREGQSGQRCLSSLGGGCSSASDCAQNHKCASSICMAKNP
eukprot:gnl/MRDRNA2_/MRDRNA2_95789_c0_seq1.p1 gnl/MRDRNA2_/MRDRNA2_95789_c0~~gnl/MRDRNA2_/MRDRNA2_95789_c0_seq1.p1  ORF type:complete len:234 (+),score=27.09 gnl/MRDRNA2_/MRDRNA2_95789_c0_seq1:104-805(+)